jgi:hypothetical protein
MRADWSENETEVTAMPVKVMCQAWSFRQDYANIFKLVAVGYLY